MFSLVHFSRVFPYIHPYLFPIETPKTSGRASEEKSLPALPAAAAASPSMAEGAALLSPYGQGRRLKSLYRRHLRNQRNETLTYSGAFRHAAW